MCDFLVHLQPCCGKLWPKLAPWMRPRVRGSCGVSSSAIRLHVVSTCTPPMPCLPSAQVTQRRVAAAWAHASIYGIYCLHGRQRGVETGWTSGNQSKVMGSGEAIKFDPVAGAKSAGVGDHWTLSAGSPRAAGNGRCIDMFCILIQSGRNK